MYVHDPKLREGQRQRQAPSASLDYSAHCLYLEVIKIYASFHLSSYVDSMDTDPCKN